MIPDPAGGKVIVQQCPASLECSNRERVGGALRERQFRGVWHCIANYDLQQTVTRELGGHRSEWGVVWESQLDSPVERRGFY